MDGNRKSRRLAEALEHRGIEPAPELIQQLMTTKEASAYVRLGKPTLERFRISGDGPPFCKLGGAVRYRKIDLDKWLESRLVRSTSEVA